jgi:hypothetical protein
VWPRRWATVGGGRIRVFGLSGVRPLLYIEEVGVGGQAGPNGGVKEEGSR